MKKGVTRFLVSAVNNAIVHPGRSLLRLSVNYSFTFPPPSLSLSLLSFFFSLLLVPF